ncbi:Hint domain-containing protein [Jannaschia pohangensis]|uniref:Hint domain-containing protein n=1 Tax=Jannaschia pohangensis TaxID=390807 RepID=A0A1I3IHN6_9RHOB|nr:Hint domain-containing protein [Jannaschia pohangensis]SFI47441.1 Hint domain-containing protein [Jannaschia pohangensis]
MTVVSPPSAPLGVPVLRDHSLRHALPSGSHVLTARGETLVEALVPGDRVITRDYGIVPLRRVIRGVAPAGSTMVLFPAGSMGWGRPERNILLPLDQPIVLRDWRARSLFGAREARVAAVRLVDGAIIRQVAAPAGSIWSLILDRPSAIYVDGLEVVTASNAA